MSRKRKRASKRKQGLKDQDRLRKANIPSASGRGTISKSYKLGWAFDETKQDSGGCQYIEKKSPPPSYLNDSLDQ